MKDELIGYHEQLAKTAKANGFDGTFHERAVAWLEGPQCPELHAVWDGNAWVSPFETRSIQ